MKKKELIELTKTELEFCRDDINDLRTLIKESTDQVIDQVADELQQCVQELRDTRTELKEEFNKLHISLDKLNRSLNRFTQTQWWGTLVYFLCIVSIVIIFDHLNKQDGG